MVGILRYCTLLSIAVCLALSCEPAIAARLVKVRVYLNGEVILEGSFSVDGSDDADECWRIFQRGTEKKKKWAGFRETKEFDQTRLTVDKSAADRLVLKTKDGERISVSVGYGGIAKVKELNLYRYAEPAKGKNVDKRRTKRPPRKWMLDAKQLDKLFANRKISDREAARLKTRQKAK